MDKIILTQLSVEELKAIIKDCLTKETNATVSEPEKLLSKKAVAIFFGVSVITIADWMASGKLPYIRMKRRVYFKQSEILKALSGFSVKYKNRLRK